MLQVKYAKLLAMNVCLVNSIESSFTTEKQRTEIKAWPLVAEIKQQMWEGGLWVNSLL